MDWRAPHLPPLLRGLGTLLLLLTSVAVGMAEYRYSREAQAMRDVARERLESAAAAGDNDRVASLAEEVNLLRRQVQDSDLAGQVFENPWFQLLGALGTLLISGSFFLEAAQRRPRREPDDPRV